MPANAFDQDQLIAGRGLFLFQHPPDAEMKRLVPQARTAADAAFLINQELLAPLAAPGGAGIFMFLVHVRDCKDTHIYKKGTYKLKKEYDLIG